jgi:hypothetical protein
VTDHPSPRARRLSPPSWLDARLVLGLLLVLVSVVVGARVLSSADRSQLVWAAAGDLAVGSQLSEGDLTAVRVRLFDSGPAYLRAEGAAPAGYVLRRAVGAGELLPQDALARPGADVDVRLVTVPVEAGHYPPTLQADQRVDLWVTPRTQDAPQDAPPQDSPPQDAPAPAVAPGPAALRLEGAQQVLSQATVVTGPPAQDVPGSGGTVPVVLLVSPGDVPKVVSALGLGRLDVVRVPRQSEAQGELVAPVEAG